MASAHAAEVHDDRLGGYFLVTVTPLRDESGQIIGSVHVARDINEQKKALEVLATSAGTPAITNGT